MTGGGTYEMPKNGWTCYHCGETFTTPGSARDHFGETEEAVAGCIIHAGDEKGLLMALRKSEHVVRRLTAFRNTVAAAVELEDELGG